MLKNNLKCWVGPFLTPAFILKCKILTLQKKIYFVKNKNCLKLQINRSQVIPDMATTMNEILLASTIPRQKKHS